MKSISVLAALILGAMACAQSGPPNVTKQQLDQMTADYNKAKAAYKKTPNKKSKMALVVATDRLATATMTTDVLDPRTRYPAALGLYQQALVLDPKNHEASNNANMIDSVYGGMIVKARAKLKANPKDQAAAAQLARLTAIYTKIHRPLP